MLEKPDDPPTNVRAVPQQERDELRAAWSSMMRTMAVMAENASAIARHRKKMFDAYVAAGFTEPQAIDLCKSSYL